MLFEIRQYIWKCHDAGMYVVIPTNVGWTKGSSNVMGAGLAKQAAQKYNWLTRHYGDWCRRYGSRINVVRADRLILFPVKPLNEDKPWLSWQNGASLELIKNSLDQLAEWASNNPSCHIAMPYVGCGNGRLNWHKQVAPLVDDANIPNMTVVDINAPYIEISQLLECEDPAYLICWKDGDWAYSVVATGDWWLSGNPDEYMNDAGISFGDNPWTAQDYYEKQYDWCEVYEYEDDWNNRITCLEMMEISRGR